MIVFTMRMGVASFLAISGLLVTISMLKNLEKTYVLTRKFTLKIFWKWIFSIISLIRKGKINIPMLYLNRYLRLTPVFAVILLIVMSLYRFVGTGPLWPTIFNGMRKPCEDKWWLALLYVQNYVTPPLVNFICKTIKLPKFKIHFFLYL